MNTSATRNELKPAHGHLRIALTMADGPERHFVGMKHDRATETTEGETVVVLEPVDRKDRPETETPLYFLHVDERLGLIDHNDLGRLCDLTNRVNHLRGLLADSVSKLRGFLASLEEATARH